MSYNHIYLYIIVYKVNKIMEKLNYFLRAASQNKISFIWKVNIYKGGNNMIEI